MFTRANPHTLHLGTRACEFHNLIRSHYARYAQKKERQTAKTKTKIEKRKMTRTDGQRGSNTRMKKSGTKEMRKK
jgi:hypothetical protein